MQSILTELWNGLLTHYLVVIIVILWQSVETEQFTRDRVLPVFMDIFMQFTLTEHWNGICQQIAPVFHVHNFRRHYLYVAKRILRRCSLCCLFWFLRPGRHDAQRTGRVSEREQTIMSYLEKAVLLLRMQTGTDVGDISFIEDINDDGFLGMPEVIHNLQGAADIT